MNHGQEKWERSCKRSPLVSSNLCLASPRLAPPRFAVESNKISLLRSLSGPLEVHKKMGVSWERNCHRSLWRDKPCPRTATFKRSADVHTCAHTYAHACTAYIAVRCSFDEPRLIVSSIFHASAVASIESKGCTCTCFVKVIHAELRRNSIDEERFTGDNFCSFQNSPIRWTEG